jgi:hypothetical protein
MPMLYHRFIRSARKNYRLENATGTLRFETANPTETAVDFIAFESWWEFL